MHVDTLNRELDRSTREFDPNGHFTCAGLCGFCDRGYRHLKHDYELTVLGIPVNMKIPAWQCNRCSGVIVGPMEGEAFKRALRDFVIRHHPGSQFVKAQLTTDFLIYQAGEQDMSTPSDAPTAQTDDTTKFVEGGREFIRVQEETRRYLYPGKEWVDYEEVSAVHVSPSGHHYLVYGNESQFKAIVAPGWRSIILVGTPKWTF